jgi:asparagine synthase (glutamine-hydrolysing)
MCGIFGICGITGQVEREAQLKKMMLSLAHRGPDAQGVYVPEGSTVAVGHVRLSIVDLSSAANQPMFSRDGKIVIVFNGEIYNYKELRQSLEFEGVVFRTRSDTEVVLEGYRAWGTSIFNKLKGMWAICIHDNRIKQIILSRDHLGIKPLYYGFLNNVLYFGSEPKAMKACSPSFADVDEVSVVLFERYGVLDRVPWTFYSKILAFPPASFAVIDEGTPNVKTECFWIPPTVDVKLKYKDAVNNVKELLVASVKRHMQSDVELGACLSGGIDSSAIVSICSSLSETPIKTFTTRFPNNAEIDETRWEKLIANKYNTISTYCYPSSEAIADDLDDLVYFQDEPFGSMSIYSQYCVFKEIKKNGVKVVLDGQGSDELFGGYVGYYKDYLKDRLIEKKYIQLLREEIAILRLWGWVGGGIVLSPRECVDSVVKRLKNRGKNTSLKKKFHVDDVGQRLFLVSRNEKNYDDVLRNLLMYTNLPQLLRYEDRNSMAFSIESRVPFLDIDLVNYGLQTDYKLKGGYTKAVLRDALAGIIPLKTRKRIDKLGFPAPDVEWMKLVFGLNVSTAGSSEWRKIIVNKWRASISSGGHNAL